MSLGQHVTQKWHETRGIYICDRCYHAERQEHVDWIGVAKKTTTKNNCNMDKSIWKVKRRKTPHPSCCEVLFILQCQRDLSSMPVCVNGDIKQINKNSTRAQREKEWERERVFGKAPWIAKWTLWRMACEEATITPSNISTTIYTITC